MNLLDLSILKNQSITLASWTAEDSSAVKGQVKSFGELGSRVTEETDLRASQHPLYQDSATVPYKTYTGATRRIKRFTPRLRSVWMLESHLQYSGLNVHEGIINSNDENATGILQLLMVDIARNMRVRT
jgi:hypothetical protein